MTRRFLVLNDEPCKIMAEEDLRTNWETLLGLKLQIQALHKSPFVTIFEITDEKRALKYISHPKVTIVEGLSAANTLIENLFSDFKEYALTDSTALQVSMTMSGIQNASGISGYNAKEAFNSQSNLKTLHSAGLCGIRHTPKPGKIL
jgi:hypothetical protein